jgi:hypothetical protein
VDLPHALLRRCGFVSPFEIISGFAPRPFKAVWFCKSIRDYFLVVLHTRKRLLGPFKAVWFCKSIRDYFLVVLHTRKRLLGPFKAVRFCKSIRDYFPVVLHTRQHPQ